MLKHGDTKQEFTSGAHRDSQDDKPRPDLISPIFLTRLGKLLADGAKHYGERNWEKGIPLSRLLSSAMRHMVQTLAGDTDEDHPIQCTFNLMAYVHTKKKVEDGELPAELNDLPLKRETPGHICPPAKEGHILVCMRCGSVHESQYSASRYCPRCMKEKARA